MADNVSRGISPFDPAEHKRRQTWKVLRTLKEVDGFPPKVLADLAGCPVGTLYKALPEDYDSAESPKAEHIDLLRARLASEYGNYRLIHKDLPDGDQITRRAGPARPNGLEDEGDDLSIAAAEITAAKRSRCADVVDGVADKLEALIPRLRAEAAALREMEARHVTTSGDGAPPLPPTPTQGGGRGSR